MDQGALVRCIFVRIFVDAMRSKVKPEYMVCLKIYARALLAVCSQVMSQDNMGETVDVLVVGKGFMFSYVFQILWFV